LRSGHAQRSLCPRYSATVGRPALASAQALAEIATDVVLPGHGPAYRGSPVGAVEWALAAHR
jgi:glyoxylase-like metal-dependent hydrolase (beta-lactamase superfamily II)